VTCGRAAGGAGVPPAADLPADIAADPDVDPESAARTICLRLLTARARTRAELAEALRKREVPDQAAERVLNRFVEVGLIDDAAFAADFATMRQAERGLSKREIARQLRSKGIDDEVVGEVTEQLGGDREVEVARQLVARKLRSMKSLETQVTVRRLVGMLARKGYSPSLAYRVVRDATDYGDADCGGDTAPLG
jgi:regulatory protein